MESADAKNEKRRHRRDAAAAAIILTFIVLAFVVYDRFAISRDPARQAPPSHLYYYDLRSTAAEPMDRVFVGPFETFARAEAPSKETLDDGLPAGVRAWVFSCGDCADPKQRFLGYLEMYTKESRDRTMAVWQYSTTQPSSTDAMRDQWTAAQKGHLVRAVDDETWHPEFSEGGVAIARAVWSRCREPEKTLKTCLPPEAAKK